MTDEEKRANNVLVALARGYVWLLDPEDIEGERHLYLWSAHTAEVVKHRHGMLDATGDEPFHKYDSDIPDLYATNSEGSVAREEARNWLVHRGWYYTFQGTEFSDVVQVWLRNDKLTSPISVLGYEREGSTTWIEAEAAAIVCAVKAMQEDKA